MTTPTVLCPLNGLPDSERALPSAYDASDLLEAPLQLYSVVEDQHESARRYEYLEDVVARTATGRDPLPEFTVQVDPHAAKALADVTASPLVTAVMATSSQPLMHRGYLGSAAERVARTAGNPTVLFGPHAKVRLGEVERVVVPCDGSPLSEEVLNEASGWAERLGVALWVVTAISPREREKPGYSLDAESNYVRRIAGRHEADWDVLHGQDPARTIVSWAGPALIAMTTHGRSGLSRLTVGSVAAGITRWSTAPVLVSKGRSVDA